MSAPGILATAASGVQLHVLLTGFQSDPPSLAADALIALSAFAYLAGMRRLRRRRRSWPAGAAVCFCAGTFAVFVAIGSGLAAYDDSNFPAHIVQHILLMMVGPPLIVVGRPGILLAQASRGRLRLAAVRLLNSAVVRKTSGVFAFSAYYGLMWLYFLTPLYPLSERHPALHDTMHGVFLLVGLVFWQAVVAPGRAGHQSSHLRRVAMIVVGMPLEMYLGFTLHGLDHSLGPGTTPASVRSGGELFWFMSMLISGVALATALVQWAVEDERAARRLDAIAERAAQGAPVSSVVPGAVPPLGPLGNDSAAGHFPSEPGAEPSR